VTKEETQKIIDKLVSENSSKEAFFGILRYGGGTDESYIHANKSGLELFVAELLKASKKAGEENGVSTHVIELDEEVWLDGDTFIEYIETSVNRSDQKKYEYQETWKDKTVTLGCIGLIGVALISMIIGLITIFQFILN
jgi:hypothetical protein